MNLNFLNNQLRIIITEYADIVDLYFCPKTNHWQSKADISNRIFYKEFLGMKDFKDWMYNDTLAYVNFLASKMKNIRLRINQERMRQLGK